MGGQSLQDCDAWVIAGFSCPDRRRVTESLPLNISPEGTFGVSPQFIRGRVIGVVFEFGIADAASHSVPILQLA